MHTFKGVSGNIGAMRLHDLARGLELWPDDPSLRAARDAMGTRSAPVLPFLSRKNPLNRLLGRLWPQETKPAFSS